MSKKSLILALVFYIVSAVGTFTTLVVINKSSGGSDTTSQTQTPQETASPLAQLLQIQPNEPKDQACPLNGKKYTMTERQAWEKKRPLAVMIENTPDSRPQSGLTSADLVFEAIAEGGVTRFLTFFYCDVQKMDTLLAPIRSARIYYMQAAAGFNKPLYVHVGGANMPGPADALGILSDWGWTGANDLNQFSIGYPTFVRNYNRLEGKEIATEHTMETSTEKLWKVAEKRGWTNMSPDLKYGKKVVPGTDWKDGYKPWSFQEGKAGSAAQEIAYEFWTGFAEYGVKWVYDPATNAYKRFLAGEAHNDLNNNQQIAASNVVVFLTTEKGPIDDKKHMLYTMTGTGDALIFQNGQAIKATWSKKDDQAQLMFKDEKGKEIQFVAGLTWISIVDKSTKVAY